jgi:hypothetical protein
LKSRIFYHAHRMTVEAGPAERRARAVAAARARRGSAQGSAASDALFVFFCDATRSAPAHGAGRTAVVTRARMVVARVVRPAVAVGTDQKR